MKEAAPARPPAAPRRFIEAGAVPLQQLYGALPVFAARPARALVAALPFGLWGP